VPVTSGAGVAGAAVDGACAGACAGASGGAVRAPSAIGSTREGPGKALSEGGSASRAAVAACSGGTALPRVHHQVTSNTATVSPAHAALRERLRAIAGAPRRGMPPI
jgi:hypothetical protein